MKYLNILSFLLLGLVAYVSAQGCPGTPQNPSCSGRRDWGRWGRGCSANNRWYYNPAANMCFQFVYFGCAGNNNRWCNRAICEQRCRRR